jgi:hypothetical protein
MDIKDFLPKYPNIEETKYPIMNPYDENFYEAIFRKKEFYENRLDRVEMFPKERGMLTKYQVTIARYLSSTTPYDRLLMVHAMGSGKCVLPDTKINVNDTLQTIESLWNSYSTSKTPDNEGEWTTPSIKLFVNSYNEKEGCMVIAPVRNMYRQYISEPVRKITIQGGHVITTTKAHKILTEKGWSNEPEKCQYAALPKGRGSLCAKSQVSRSGVGPRITLAKILSIEEYDYQGPVYDLEIDQLHNYVANGIITHNTCSAIGAIEQIKGEDSTFTGALILAKGPNVLSNFQKELVEKCTAGQYMPANYNKLTDLERVHRVNKKTQYYQLKTFTKFAKRIKALSDQDIVDSYSNLIIVIDEVHNLRIQKDAKKLKSTIETYNQYHRFLHLVKNCKIIFLSGTPMKDTPDEIASVMNLLLPLDQQLPTGENFINEYMVEVGNTHQMIPEKAEELKHKLSGKISFLREMESTVTKEFLGEANYGKLNHFIVDPGIMSKFQTRGYKVAKGKDEKGLSGVYTNARDASLFVYPDGSFGSKGFEKYIQIVKTKKMTQNSKEYTVSSFRMSKELRDTLQGDTPKETLANIRKYSVTYAKVLEQIINTNGNCFIYCALVQGSGCILFSLLLELFNYKKATGKDTTPGLRYAILTHETATPTDIRRINSRYNNPDNTHGEFIKVVIGSKTVSESFSLRNVIFEAVLTPWWNYSETAQALARGIRLGSHNDLVNPVVHIMQTVAIPNDDTPSIDLLMYETSEDKEISIRSILRILMEVAFDCGLNYMRNHIKGKKGSRECDYASCNYNCYGMDMQQVKNGLDDSQLDYSTYQLYYANPKTPLIRKKIENIFRENYKTDLQSIIKNLQGQFTEEEIRNSLYIIQEESESDEFDYRNFLRIYSRTPVKRIINKVEEMFRDHFRLDFQSITDQLPEYSEFEILTALQTIINESVVLVNKYGLPSYLREEKECFLPG